MIVPGFSTDSTPSNGGSVDELNASGSRQVQGCLACSVGVALSTEELDTPQRFSCAHRSFSFWICSH